MRGFKLGLGFSNGGGAYTPPTPPAVLPSISTPVQTAYGATLLVSGYSGPCIRVRRASDGGEQDIGFVNGLIDMASASAFAAGSELTIPTWYDQSGNAYHATQSTVANQPRLRTQNAWRGLQGITFDGFAETQGGTQITKFLTMPAGVTTDRRAAAGFVIMAPKSSYNDIATVEYGSTTVRLLPYAGQGVGGSQLNQGTGSAGQSTRFWRGNPSVNGWRCNASNSFIYQDITTDTVGARTAGSATGGRIGGSAAGDQFAYRGELFAVVSYAADIGPTDAATVQSALVSAYTISYDQTDLIIVEGDSGPEGTSDSFCMNVIRQTLPQLLRDVHMVNMAVHGTQAATEYARRAVKLGGTNRTVSGKKIMVFSYGSNDLNASVTGVNLFNNTVLPYIQYIQGQGFSAIISTILPRVDFTSGSSKEIQRLEFNQLLRDNAATYGYAVADYVSDPRLDTPADTADTTYWNADRIHMNSAGQGIAADILAPQINAILSL